MKKSILAYFCLFAAPCMAAAPTLEWTEKSPAKNWQESSLTGNGTIGAMVEGNLEDEAIHLSHAKLYLPESGDAAPALVGFPKRKAGDYNDRDGFMAACDLRIATRLGKTTGYQRKTVFTTGECVVNATDAKGNAYERRVVALRGANIAAVKISDAGRREPFITLAGIAPEGWYAVKAFATGVLKTESRPDYFRCEFKNSNPWNPLAGYEVAMARCERNGAIELFVAIEPLLKGQKTNLPAMEERLANAAREGYDKLLAPHAAWMAEMMGRVEFELEGPDDAEDIVRRFQAGRYNIISSTGGDHVPNLQGVWAGTWAAPWFASFTVNGNLPCAISFFNRERAWRCLQLLNAKNWLSGGGSCHDWKNCFNTDISGGYPYLVSEMLVRSDDGGEVAFLPALPACWKNGRISGLLLRGGKVLKDLSWNENGVTHSRIR